MNEGIHRAVHYLLLQHTLKEQTHQSQKYSQRTRCNKIFYYE